MTKVEKELKGRKQTFLQSAFFCSFKDSLEAFLLKKDYTRCFPKLFKEGITPGFLAQAFSVMIMFRPDEAKQLFGKASNFSYRECIENFKDYAVEYNQYYNERIETHD